MDSWLTVGHVARGLGVSPTASYVMVPLGTGAVVSTRELRLWLSELWSEVSLAQSPSVADQRGNLISGEAAAEVNKITAIQVKSRQRRILRSSGFLKLIPLRHSVNV